MILFLLDLYEILTAFSMQFPYFSDYTLTVVFWQPYQNNNYLAYYTNKDPKKSRNILRKISMVESCFDKITG